MVEPWLTKLKALEAHIAALQKTRAQTRAEADTWSKLREELERIIPRAKRHLRTPPALPGDFAKPVETRWSAEETALWDELRAQIEALRSKVRVELEAHRSRRRPEAERKSPPKRP